MDKLPVLVLPDASKGMQAIRCIYLTASALHQNEVRGPIRRFVCMMRGRQGVVSPLHINFEFESGAIPSSV